jgi:cytochrome c biogenesis protein CcdA/thiol-disulfide isomerase/thioredoxin
MALLIVSFIAGILTVLAPCILPVLPVVLGSAASGRSRLTPYRVVASLGLSVVVFTYILKFSTALIMVPPQVWTYLSGGILLLFGVTLLVPSLWAKIPLLSRIGEGSNKIVGEGVSKQGVWGDVLVGAALGPIFSTCSPTYFVILASVLPASFALGSLYIFAYVAGLSIMLLLIALIGQRFAFKLTALANPNSLFKRAVGVLFIALGLLIALGYEKKLEVAILDSGYFDITKVEHWLLQRVDNEDEAEEADTKADVSAIDVTEPHANAEINGKEATPKVNDEDHIITNETIATTMKDSNHKQYKEIVNPSGYVNTSGLTLGELIGKKVILLDFLTYSCINCQRTFPYVNAWYESYKDNGLEIVGIHTPEFAFEKNIDNVRKSMDEFGIKHPIVLDNDYATWRAYGNRYWPRKYLIDIHGNIVYDHIGEGAYEETESRIREALEERALLLGQSGGDDMEADLAIANIPASENRSQSPETYFGSLRNDYLANGKARTQGEQSFVLPTEPIANLLYMGGKWNIQPEYAESVENSLVLYKYNAKEVYIVAEAFAQSGELKMFAIEIWQDGKKVAESAGADVDESGMVQISNSRLYKLILNPSAGEHTLELRTQGAGVRLYAFTFG